jgi:uncharacterized protein (DUF305 family)
MPGNSSPEAGFARDMSVHHAQAVAMAEAIRDRTTDAELRLLAANIALGQQNQIGRMTGWLDEWHLPVSSNNVPMAWAKTPSTTGSQGTLDMGTMVMPTTPAGDSSMPGLATRPEISALGTLPIDEAEISFLKLMIAHHRGGVLMASAILSRTERTDVRQLATSIVNSQLSEIGLMTQMLAKRGATP